MALFKRKTEKELRAELAVLQSRAKIKAHRKRLKADIRKLRYGKIIKGAKVVGKGAVVVGKGAVKVIDIMAPPRKAAKRKKRRTTREGYGFGDFDYF